VSLLLRDRLGVALFPERLILARTGTGLRRRLKTKEIVALPPGDAAAPPWQSVVDALAERVRAGAMAGADVTLVLSSRFVRYALIPASDALKSKEEETAFARHCFARIYGSQADDWTLKLSQASGQKPRLACGVERALVDALTETMAPLGRRYRSLQPHLMASFNRWRARLGERPGWFVVAEPGLLAVALVQGSHWCSVRTVKVGSEWPGELPGVLAREECLVDSDAACDEVLVFAPDGPDPLILEAGRWRIRSLLPALLPGMLPGVDAPYSIALGV
jgi:hypothetical protein